MVKINATNPNTGEIVLSAIKKLMKNTGWTTRTIVKFIRMEYGVISPAMSRKVSRALKKGVRLGLLQMERGHYRLNDMSRLARPVTARELRERPRGRQQAVRLRSRSRSRVPSRPRSRVPSRLRSREPSWSRSREPSRSPSPQRDRRDRKR